MVQLRLTQYIENVSKLDYILGDNDTIFKNKYS